MEESPTKLAARRQARGDIESAVRDTNCADSCSSLDGYGKPPYGSSGSDDGGGSPGVLDWKSDANEAGEGLQPSDSAGDRRGCWCSGGTSVALICLLLTLSSFVVPKSNEHVGAVIGHAQRLGSRAKQLGDRAREDASFQKSALIAKMQGKRHCRAPPRTLRDGTVQRLHVAGLEEKYVMDPPKNRGQWLVSARFDGLLTIMTPIYPDEKNLALLLNQLRSANQFLNMDSIKEWIFVAPKKTVPRLVNLLEEELVALPCVLARKMRVVADEACAPELRPWALRKIAGNEAGAIDGWYKQQLIKLSCSFTVQTPYFLITDTDTFFLRDFEALDLMHQEEGCNATAGVCDLQKQVHFRARNEMANMQVAHEQEQVEWISRSARVLNITVTIPEGGMDTMGVTPQIMSRAVLDPLAAHIEKNMARPKETWRAYLLRVHVEGLRDPEKKTHASWTEYDLYWTFAAHNKLWSKYHEHGILQRTEANLWWEEQYAEWDPCKKFDDMELDRGYWAVVQSRLNISADQIWTKLKPCMQHSIMSARPLNGTEEAAPV